MDYVRKPTMKNQMYKKVKVAKKIKPGKLFERITGFFRMLFPPTAPPPPPPAAPIQDDLSFMTFVIKVNSNKAGWHKAIISLLRKCKGARFKMDQEGVVEVSGMSNPYKLLKKIGESSRLELHWYQFGECSSNLFMPESKKVDADAKKKPNNFNPHPYYSNNNNNNSLVYLPMYNNGDYGYHYQLPPQVFKHPYAPY
ncbi:hypothetical protein OROGR_002958 [Orobanche gracilis]